MTDDLCRLANLELTLGYAFSNLSLLQLALTHRSFGPQHNERLEFLGDSILGMIISLRLYELFPSSPEGDMTRMRSALVREATLAQLAREFQINLHLRLGQGELKTGGAQRDSLLADALESLIGAMFLDSGGDFVRVQEVVLHWFDKRLSDINPRVSHKDPKSALQELLQARRHALPNYRVERISGADNNQMFYVILSLPEYHRTFRGQGTSRRRAEQEAAALALQHLSGSEAR